MYANKNTAECSFMDNEFMVNKIINTEYVGMLYNIYTGAYYGNKIRCTLNYIK